MGDERHSQTERSCERLSSPINGLLHFPSRLITYRDNSAERRTSWTNSPR